MDPNLDFSTFAGPFPQFSGVGGGFDSMSVF